MKTSKLNPALADLKAIKKALKNPLPQTSVSEEVGQPASALRFSLEPRRALKQEVTSMDKTLFQEAVKGATPLKTKNSQHLTTHKHPKRPTTEQQLQRQRHATGQEELLEVYGLSDEFSLYLDEQPLKEYLSSSCGSDVLRNLKKGRWAIVNHIDLHGSTLEQARLRLNYFLKHSLVEQYKCVRIVHGKGYGSKGQGPVLPLAVRRWLSQLDFVLAFCDCSPAEGGSGAVKVLLRNQNSYM